MVICVNLTKMSGLHVAVSHTLSGKFHLVDTPTTMTGFENVVTLAVRRSISDRCRDGSACSRVGDVYYASIYHPHKATL